MKFTFKDITSTEMYSTARVLFVVGQYSLFNNLAIDAIRDICKPDEEFMNDPSIVAALQDEDEDTEDIMAVINNKVTLDNFMRVHGAMPMMGLWFCSVDYSFMTKKQLSWLDSYIKAPSSYGRLVVFCTEWRKYSSLLKNKIIKNSSFVHLIQLSFPSKYTLQSVISELFLEKGVRIEQRAIELFIMRMSNSYDQYGEVIDKIIAESVPNDVDGTNLYTITYEDTLNAMKGIENFVIDDFIAKLLDPLKSDKTNGKNKIYRMLGSLLEEFGARQLVNRLKNKIDDYIEFRIAINTGIIPIVVKYSVQEAKNRLGEKHKLSKYSDYTFRKMANIASQTSLRDWMYMKMILGNVSKMSDSSYEKALYSLINRSVLTESRINNDIGISNIATINIDNLDRIAFNERNLMFNGGTQ